MKLGPGDVNASSTPLDVALSKVGPHETTGPNRGPLPDECQRLVGLVLPADPAAEGNKWCVAFIYYCFRTAGRWFPRTASVRRAAELLRAHALPPGEPWRPGDVACHIDPAARNHITLLQRADEEPGFWWNVSGNTSHTGSNDGQGVWSVRRSVSYYTHVFRIPA